MSFLGIRNPARTTTDADPAPADSDWPGPFGEPAPAALPDWSHGCHRELEGHRRRRGSVGSSTAYAALIRGSARHVALYDIATAKVEAEVLDLAHGTQFTGSSDIIGGSDISVVEGSHVVVITAGAKQNPGQTRIELAGRQRPDPRSR